MPFFKWLKTRFATEQTFLILKAKRIALICHLVAHLIWESHTTLFLAVSSRDWITFSLCLKRICSISSAFKLLNFYKRKKKADQVSIISLRTNNPCWITWSLTSVVYPQRLSRTPRNLLPAAKRWEKTVEMNWNASMFLQHTSWFLTVSTGAGETLWNPQQSKMLGSTYTKQKY